VAIKLLEHTAAKTVRFGGSQLQHQVAVGAAGGLGLVLSDEMKLLRDLNHPNVVQCFGIVRLKVTGGQSNAGQHRCSIVTELCAMSLERYLADDSCWQVGSCCLPDIPVRDTRAAAGAGVHCRVGI
jgi:hypothetical protein